LHTYRFYLFVALRYYQQPPFPTKTAVLLKSGKENDERCSLYEKQGVSVKPKILEQKSRSVNSVFKISGIFHRF